MIITKGAGVSLAMDVSHSRPHKTFAIAPFTPFERFVFVIEQVLRASHFSSEQKLPAANIRRGDARSIPLKDGVADLVLTSPPHLNAIDYLRGHKLSLVWMGQQIDALRELRSSNIGSKRFRNPAAAMKYRGTAERIVRDLVLMSDGIVEAMDANGELLGFERMRELAVSANSAADVAAAAQRFGQEDDISVISVTRNAAGLPAFA
jgi:Stage II sporulation protein E (SpoIIE)